MSFFSFLESHSVSTEPTGSESVNAPQDDQGETASPPPGSSREPRADRPAARLGAWIRGFRRRVTPETTDPATVSERDRSSAPDPLPDSPAVPPIAERKGISLRRRATHLAGIASLIWGVTYLLVTFAGSVERRTVAETFPPLVQTDYLRRATPSLGNAGTGGASPVAEVTAENAAELAATAEDDPAAAAALADHYLPLDRALGLRWLTRSAELGHARHQRQLGLRLAEIPDHLPEAVTWLERAAAQGDVEGQLYYGAALLNGHGVDPDPAAALVQIRRAADAGDGRALDLLGTCLAEGIGCAPDPSAAFRHFQQAVAARNSRACYNLAVRHAKGLGTSRNDAQAAEIFHIGAELGDPDCMHAYGRCLESGFGTAEDFGAAVMWMRKAADLGQQDALAWCLRQGIAIGVAGN